MHRFASSFSTKARIARNSAQQIGSRATWSSNYAAKDIKFGVGARALMSHGFEELVDTVKVTMGPKAKKEAGQIPPVFHQARFSSSVAAEHIQSSSPSDGKKNILRPLSPHLPVYQPQLSSTNSITHRISVAYLTAVALSFHLLYLKMGPTCLSFHEFYQLLFYSSKLTTVSLELSALAFTYCLWHMIHHLRGIGAKISK